MPYFKKLKTIGNNFQNTANKIKHALEGIINNIDDDPVYKAFYSLYNSKKSARYPICDALIKRSHERYLLGNPPGNDKKTIGDQLIWEILLSNLKENLVIVTRDKTYKNNMLFLKTEFNRITNKDLIIITDKISDALQKVGIEPPEEIIELEGRQEEGLPPIYFDINSYFNQPVQPVLYPTPVGTFFPVSGSWAIVNDVNENIIKQPEYGSCEVCGKYNQLYDGKCFKCSFPSKSL